MAEEKDKKNQKADCPLCNVSEETIKILKEKAKDKEKDNK